MSKNTEDHIVRISQLQDAIEKKYLSEDKIITERFNYSVKCLNLVYEYLTKEGKTKEEITLSPLLSDSFSSLLVSMNICLWGTTQDSLAVLRPVLESLAIAEYVIDNKKFESLEKERLGKQFKGLDFKCLKQLKLLDENLIKEWKKISNEASHTSAERLRVNRFEMDGKTYPMLGAAYDVKKVGIVYGRIVNTCLYFTRVIIKTLPSEERIKEEQKILEKEYLTLLKITETLEKGQNDLLKTNK